MFAVLAKVIATGTMVYAFGTVFDNGIPQYDIQVSNFETGLSVI